MNFQQLEYIVSLDKHRHFAKAAEYCDVSQPTLSTMIQKLEEELGVKIFDRERKPISPTLIGQEIIKQAARVLHEANNIHLLIHESRHSAKGIVRLAILPTIAPYLLPVVGGKLQEALPEVEFNIFEMTTSESLKALLDDEIEIAIIATKSETEGLRDTLLFYDEFLGYVSKSEPLYQEKAIRSSEVDGQKLWLLDEDHCFRDQLIRFCNLKTYIERSIKYRRGSMETFMRFVESGIGITFIPSMAVRALSAEQNKHVRPFAIPRPTREIRIITREDFIRTEVLERIITTIKAVVPKITLELQIEQTIV